MLSQNNNITKAVSANNNHTTHDNKYHYFFKAMRRRLGIAKRFILRKMDWGLPRILFGLSDYFYDMRRFVAHSSTMRSRLDERQLAAVITKEYHRIEKGLALPEPKPGFARDRMSALFSKVTEHENRFGPAVATRGARSALEAYIAHHVALGMTFPELGAFRVKEADIQNIPAGAMNVTRDEIVAATSIPYERFVQSRFSVRDFTGEPVTEEEIFEAVRLASRAPRVCNRGTTRVHAAYDREMQTRILSYQNGNLGFGHLAGAVLIVTSDLRGFTDFGERNQCWVDGGLFAMSLVHALHAQALGTCMLNWSVSSIRDRRMRRNIGIPDSEAVITLMAVGRLPDRFKVAISPRYPVSSMLHTIGSGKAHIANTNNNNANNFVGATDPQLRYFKNEMVKGDN